MMNPVVAEVLLAVHVILPLAEEYPAGIVYTLAVAQTVAVLVAPAVATGSGVMVRLNVVLAGAQIPPSSTVMVSVTVAPEAISAALKLYVGVSVPLLVKVPFVPDVLLAVQVIEPFVDPYPDGMV
jgi:hypothetical protein